MTDPPVPDRLAAALRSRYRVERELGAGGMAVVYLAHDEKHNRDVALKVLRPELAAIIGAERFLAEIEVTAQLQHPHILPLFDSGEADGFLYYVMPYVQGESLEDRLKREGQLPVADAIRIGAEVADALDYAHRHGVIHRDVKPANVLLHDGRVLVADFGIALAVRQAGGERLTETGLSVGTPHYMSPEQATADRDADARSDIYSLGAMVYEMLAGRPPHMGTSLQSVIASVLTKTPPPVDEDRSSIPSGLAAVVHRAIERLPADRYQTAADFRAALADPPAPASAWRSPGARPSPARERIAWAVAGVAIVFAAMLGLTRSGSAPSGEGGSETRFVVTLPFADLAENQRRASISPDGSRIIATASSGERGYLRLHERRLDDIGLTEFAPTLYGRDPLLSPDGRFLAHDNDGNLLEDLERGGTRDLPGEGGYMWGWDGLLYVPTAGGTLLRVSPESGVIDTVFTLSDAEIDSGQFPNVPSLLPGGAGLVYHAFVSSLEAPDVMVYDFESGERRPLLRGAAAAIYLPFGVLVYQRSGGVLEGVRFDPRTFELLGEPRLLETGLRWESDPASFFSVSANGVLLYERAMREHTRPVWVEADGSELPLDASFAERGVTDVEFSPDGSRLAYSSVDGRGESIWLYDFDQGTHTRFSVVEAANTRPSWTPDGRSISFVSDRDSLRAIYTRPVDGSAPARLEIGSTRLVQQIAWRRDGAFVYREGYDDGGTNRDLYYRLPGDTVSRAIAATEFDELAAAFSPDGNWLAYVSNESGNDQIYLRPFPDGPRTTISVSGGSEPAWSGDGRTLYYKSAADTLVAARLSFVDGEARVRTREGLFPVARYTKFRNDRSYTVDPAAERFIFIRGPDEVELVVVTGWFDRVKAIFGIEE